MRNLHEQVKKAFCYQKLFWPFTVWINCCSLESRITRTIFSHSRSEPFLVKIKKKKMHIWEIRSIKVKNNVHPFLHNAWPHLWSTVYRGAFCKFTFQWIYYCHSSKFIGNETGKTHLCAVMHSQHNTDFSLKVWGSRITFWLVWVDKNMYGQSLENKVF